MIFYWTRNARRHRIGRAHAKAVIARVEPVLEPGGGDRGDDVLRWVGLDDRGVELEIVGIVMSADETLIVHVMPTHYRR